MDRRLKEVAEAGDINGLYAVFGESPNVLEKIDEISFVDTPLHVAADKGYTHFAVELISLKPSFGRKLNPDGLSPLHLAVRNGHTETVKRLINIDSQLIRVQGKERITPLHLVAERKDEIDVLAEFVCACPASIEDLTVRGETALHIAVQKGNFEAFKVLLGWLRKSDNGDLLDWKDEDGNTALHIAASIHQLEVVKLLINHNVDKHARNLKGKTALDLCERNEEVRKVILGGEGILKKILVWAGASKTSTFPPKETSLAQFISRGKLPDEKMLWLVPNMYKGLSKETRKSLLVVALLIVTAAYQIVLQPPGGFGQQDNNLTIPLLNTATAINTTSINTYLIVINNTAINPTAAVTVALPRNKFDSISLFNSFAFAAGIGVICLVLPITNHSFLLALSLIFLTVSYTSSMHQIAPSGYYLYISYFPYLSFMMIFCMRSDILNTEARIFGRVPLCRYNPSHYLEMRRKFFGW